MDAERVKSATDLAGLCGELVRLRGGGATLYGKCPWHGGDGKATLRVTPSKGLWHCFKCGSGGSAIDWVMMRDGVDFKSALAILSARAGL